GTVTFLGRDVPRPRWVATFPYTTLFRSLTFGSFATLQGGTGIDTFNLAGAAAYNLKGGAGVDVFALGGNTLTGSIDGEANGGSITGIGSATLTTQGATTGFNGTAASVKMGRANV